MAVPLKAPPKPLNQVLVSVFPLPFYFYVSAQSRPGSSRTPQQFPLLCFSCSVAASGRDAWWGSLQSETMFILLSVISLGRALLHSIHQLLGWFQGPLEGSSVVSFHFQILFFHLEPMKRLVSPCLTFIAPPSLFCFLYSFSFACTLSWEVMSRGLSALLGTG